MKFVVIGCLCAGTLAAAGCAGVPVGPTSPSESGITSTLAPTVPVTEGIGAVTPSLSAAPRSGDLHVTKECTQYTGRAGSFCTITSSNVKAIEVGSRVIYAQAAGAASLDSTVVLDTPGPGNNQAFGHCALNFATGLGLCTFSGGTGKFMGFSATAHITPPTPQDPDDWHWDGTYSFSQQD
jgi:hypothetical protein